MKLLQELTFNGEIMKLRQLKETTRYAALTANARTYTGSGPFTDDLVNLGEEIANIKQVLSSHPWKHHVQETDKNYNTNAVSINNKMFKLAEQLDIAFGELMQEMTKADQG